MAIQKRKLMRWTGSVSFYNGTSLFSLSLMRLEE